MEEGEEDAAAAEEEEEEEEEREEEFACTAVPVVVSLSFAVCFLWFVLRVASAEMDEGATEEETAMTDDEGAVAAAAVAAAVAAEEEEEEEREKEFDVRSSCWMPPRYRFHSCAASEYF